MVGRLEALQKGETGAKSTEVQAAGERATCNLLAPWNDAPKASFGGQNISEEMAAVVEGPWHDTRPARIHYSSTPCSLASGERTPAFWVSKQRRPEGCEWPQVGWMGCFLAAILWKHYCRGRCTLKPRPRHLQSWRKITGIALVWKKLCHSHSEDDQPPQKNHSNEAP
mmetsp:Transcript_15961/g.34975  ORF Transcript_15961/g.34975 Transcript_15961/m.34975 type:complete len:168 (+) Transcript_15961:94-597(+)